MGQFANTHRGKATGGRPRGAGNPAPYKVVAKTRTYEEGVRFLRDRGFIGPLSQMEGQYGQKLVCHPDRRGVLQCVQFSKVALPEVVRVQYNPHGEEHSTVTHFVLIKTAGPDHRRLMSAGSSYVQEHAVPNDASHKWIEAKNGAVFRVKRPPLAGFGPRTTCAPTDKKLYGPFIARVMTDKGLTGADAVLCLPKKIGIGMQGNPTHTPTGTLVATPTPRLCYDAIAGVVRGEGSVWDGRAVELISLVPSDPPTAVVTHPDPNRAEQVTLELCPDRGPVVVTPPGRPTQPEGWPCCIDMDTGRILCQDTSDPLHNVVVPRAAWSCDADGMCSVTVSGDTIVRMPGCTKVVPGEPECCIDPVTGIITCKDTSSPLHGVEVPKAAFSCTPDGTVCSVSVGGDVTVTMPACPKVPPQECCVDMIRGVLLCKDETIAPHGAAVVEVFQTFEDGTVSLSYRGADGVVRNGRFKTCEEPPDCCYDAKTGTLVCKKTNRRDYARYHGKKVEVREIQGDVVYCKTPETSTEEAWCLRLLLCPEEPPFACCYDAMTGLLVCEPLPDGTPSPYHGLAVELLGMEDEKNAIVRHPSMNDGNRTLVPLCPEKPPVACCYDVASGKLRCTGNATWDKKEVSLLDIQMTQGGDLIAVVQHPDLPGGTYTFPVCDDEPPDDCCYDTSTRTLRCTDEELHGKTAGIIVRFEGPDGRTWVWATWEGGGGRMPLCPECPPEKCPPSFCCVNLETKTFVCPQETALQGAPAPVADVVTDDAGNKWAKMQDGTLVPVCGRQCPPPRLCPTCPPGMWLSPDGLCTDAPECPPDRRRPPGVLTPECPWWAKLGHCCENCGLGHECPGATACPTPVYGETPAQTAARARTGNPDGVKCVEVGQDQVCYWEGQDDQGQWYRCWFYDFESPFEAHCCAIAEPGGPCTLTPGTPGMGGGALPGGFATPASSIPYRDLARRGLRMPRGRAQQTAARTRTGIGMTGNPDEPESPPWKCFPGLGNLWICMAPDKSDFFILELPKGSSSSRADFVVAARRARMSGPVESISVVFARTVDPTTEVFPTHAAQTALRAAPDYVAYAGSRGNSVALAAKRGAYFRRGLSCGPREKRLFGPVKNFAGQNVMLCIAKHAYAKAARRPAAI